jgi:hypothetical protein
MQAGKSGGEYIIEGQIKNIGGDISMMTGLRVVVSVYDADDNVIATERCAVITPLWAGETASFECGLDYTSAIESYKVQFEDSEENRIQLRDDR